MGCGVVCCCYFCGDQAVDKFPCCPSSLPHLGVELPVFCSDVMVEEKEEGGKGGLGGGREGGKSVDGTI